MPPILNPLEEDKSRQNEIASRDTDRNKNNKLGVNSQEPSGMLPSGAMSQTSNMDGEQAILLKNDIEKFEMEDLPLNSVLIHELPAKPKNPFVDPFHNSESDSTANTDEKAENASEILSQANMPEEK